METKYLVNTGKQFFIFDSMQDAIDSWKMSYCYHPDRFELDFQHTSYFVSVLLKGEEIGKILAVEHFHSVTHL